MSKLLGFYRPHDPVRYDGSVRNLVTGEVTYPPSMTQQSFAAECDIHNILKQYSQTGMVTHISSRAREGAYLDLPDSMDFQEGLAIVAEGRKAFDSLPSALRSRFDNDPVRFLEFLHNPANRAEAESLGLLKTPAPGTLDAAVAPPEGHGGA